MRLRHTISFEPHLRRAPALVKGQPYDRDTKDAGGTMRRHLAVSLGGALVGAGLFVALGQGVGSAVPSPFEATYATTSRFIAVNGGHDWRAELRFSVGSGWYLVNI